MAIQTTGAISKFGAIQNVMAIQTTGAISKFGAILNIYANVLAAVVVKCQ